MVYEARVVSAAIDVPSEAVYEFARRMENWPRWASGLAGDLRQDGDHCLARSPMGEVEVRLAGRNAFGVLDHEVTLPDGTRVLNAFRVTPSGPGSIVTFTVLRMPGTSQEAFEADVAHVRKDVTELRRLLESQSPRALGQ
jgi:hypothetical protein